MPTYRTAFYELQDSLRALYDHPEATAIANHVLYQLTGLGKLARMELMDKRMFKDDVPRFHAMKERLLAGEPIQYVAGHEYFLGRPYNVSPAVLIPRPETEELVMWLDEDNDARRNYPFKILEVGTGSGCIAISLKCSFPQAAITAIDISEAALEVAKANAHRHKVAVDFRPLDFLDEEARAGLGEFQLIISNPPYIPDTEREQMHTNVRDHEPAQALFVPGDDPLLFYREIAAFGRTHLTDGGAVYCELHRDFSEETAALFRDVGYGDVALREDMHGAKRMLRALL